MTGNNEECIKHLQSQPKGIYKVSRVYKKRTPSQNNYLHAIFEIIAERIGDNPQRVKETLKKEFLETYNPKMQKTYIKSTSELNTQEMGMFIEQIRLFCLEFFNFEIPNADDKRLYDYYDLG